MSTYNLNRRNNSNGYNNYNQPPAIDFDALYNARKKSETKHAWYNSNDVREDGVDPHSIYVGEARPNIPTWSDKAFDLDEANKMYDLWKQGKVSKEDVDYAGWEKGFWQDKFGEYYSDLVNGRLYTKTAAGGMITSDDNAAINVVQILAEILGRDNREFVLEQAVRRASSPNLQLSVDTWNGFGVDKDVPEGVEVLAQKGKFTRKEVFLTKDVSHIQITDEADLRSDRDLMAEHIRHSAKQMQATKAQKIAIALESVNDTTGADLGAMTSTISTNNPLDIIGAVMDTIELNSGGNGTNLAFASHNTVFRDFMSNTYIKGLQTPGANVNTNNRIVGNVPGFPGVTWYVDNLLTNTILSVYDKDAIVLLQGPTRTETYRDPRHGFNGYITRDWNKVYILDDTLVANLTTMHV